jgi:hypothetical protein
MTEYEQTADELEERSKQLGEEINDVREDWERKRADDGVPGAPPPEKTGDEGGSEREPWPDE